VIPLAAFSLPLATPGLADGQGFSAALRCNPKEQDMTKPRKAITTNPQPKKSKPRAAAKRPERKPVKTVQRLEWKGIVVSVSYEPDWLGLAAKLGEASNVHLEIEVLSPKRAVLPITDTGYRSHFLPRNAVEVAGGPVAYVAAWLDEAAKAPAWKRRQEEGHQLSLF
jgi:hypothetical protein